MSIVCVKKCFHYFALMIYSKMKSFVSFVLVLVATTTEIRSASVVDIQLVDTFNCNGKADGNYLHPADCTRFISCYKQVATEGYCPPCDPKQDPNRCLPVGRLIFSDTKNTCLFADQTECKAIDGGGGLNNQPSMQQTNITIQTDATENQEVDPMSQNTGQNTGLQGKPCDPKECKTEGHCFNYFRCDPVSKVWIKEMCSFGLLWNPTGLDGKKQIHGGNCGDPRKLDKKTLDVYKNDPNCLGCHWKEIGECSARYLYQPPNLMYPNEQQLECDAGLVFVLAKKTCVRCQDAKKTNGQACC